MKPQENNATNNPENNGKTPRKRSLNDYAGFDTVADQPQDQPSVNPDTQELEEPKNVPTIRVNKANLSAKPKLPEGLEEAVHGSSVEFSYLSKIPEQKKQPTKLKGLYLDADVAFMLEWLGRKLGKGGISIIANDVLRKAFEASGHLKKPDDND